MSLVKVFLGAVFLLFATFATARSGWAQTGNAANVAGTVMDPSGAVVVGANVTIHNPVTGFERSATTDASGNFSFANVPFNPYHLSISATGFGAYAQDIDVRSSVPLSLKIPLTVAGSSSTVTVEGGGDFVEDEPIFDTDVDRALFDKLPLESASSSISSLVTLSTPGVAADSNGLFHGLGDHAENSFSVDGQPITDQQSKVFSNQLPIDAVQSLEVIQGAPPAEFGGKTSLVIVATTRSGLGYTQPHGDIPASYGTFGTTNDSFDLSYGGQKWGNFISVSGLNSGRFLDPPEFSVIHDKGNEENLFYRVDYQFSSSDSLHVNFGYSRSWFQNPNSFDQQTHFVAIDGPAVQLLDPLTGSPLGPTDQRSKIGTFNIAPTWTHLLGSNAVFTLAGFVRRDQYNYFPSANPFDDFSPDLQGETFIQNRTLTNAGARSSLSYVKGIHNLKAGITYEQTFLTENDGIGIVDPGLVAGITPSCLNPVTHQPVPNTPCAILAAHDLTGGGGLYTPGDLFTFHGHTDVKELALYVQDTITWKDWSFNVGIRGDFYNGLSKARQAEPRLGIAYNIKPSNTVLRVSYARTLEST